MSGVPGRRVGLELLACLRWGDLAVFWGGRNGQYVRYGYQCTYT